MNTDIRMTRASSDDDSIRRNFIPLLACVMELSDRSIVYLREIYHRSIEKSTNRN